MSPHVSAARARRSVVLALTMTALVGCGAVDGLTGGAVPSATLPVSEGAPAPTATTHGASRTDAGPERPTTPSDAPETETAEPGPFTSEELVSLAASMTEVLDRGSEEDWAGLFDLPDDGLARQRAWFRAVRATPMTVRQFLPSAVVVADTEEGSVVEVVFAHQVEGADPVPASESYRLTVRRTAGADPVITDVDGSGGATDGYPQLWDLQEVDVQVTDTLVVLAPDGREGDVAAVLPGLITAVDNVFIDFRSDDRQRLVVQLATPEDVVTILDDERWVASPLGLAFYLSGVDLQRTDPEATRVRWSDQHIDRIVLDLDSLVEDHFSYGMSPSGGWSVMRHEGVHAVLDGDPSVEPPIWLWEGVAQWYGDRRDYEVDPWYADVVERLGPPDELPTSFEQYYFGSEDQSESAYAVSAMVFTYLDRTWGFETARDVGVGLSRADAWHSDDDVDAVFLEETGLTFEQFESAWRGWVATSYG